MSEQNHTQTPTLWETIGESPMADCKVFNVVRQRARNPQTGKEGDFSVIKAPDWVVTLAFPSKDELLMVNQYRFGSHMLSWEFPAGCMEEGESPIEAAARELVEETGFAPAGEGKIVGHFFPNPALQDNTCWVVRFDKLNDTGKTNWDGFEEIEMRRVPVSEVFKMADDGRITHGMVHAALYFLSRDRNQ